MVASARALVAVVAAVVALARAWVAMVAAVVACSGRLWGRRWLQYAQLGIQLIVRYVEVSQFCEFVGDGTYMKRVQLSRSLMELSTDAEQTCQPVVRHVEESQTGKVTKLLGKAAYRKKCDYQHKITRSDRNYPLRPDAERTCQLVAMHVEESQIDKVAKLPGNAAYRKKSAVIST